MFVTAYGRNVNPEWPESEITRHAQIAHAVVFGESRNHNIAVIVPAAPQMDNSEIAALVAITNETLPDYARIHNWIRAKAPFTPDNGLLTTSGKPRRDRVLAHYRTAIESTDTAMFIQETA